MILSFSHNTEKTVFSGSHNSQPEFIHQRLIAVDLEFITFHPRKKNEPERTEWMNKICFFCARFFRFLHTKQPRTTHTRPETWWGELYVHYLLITGPRRPAGVVKVFSARFLLSSSPSINSDGLLSWCAIKKVTFSASLSVITLEW